MSIERTMPEKFLQILMLPENVNSFKISVIVGSESLD